MSWEYSTNRKCESCGFEYSVEESTLNLKNYDKCPKCGSKGKVISENSIDDEINRKIELLKKRNLKELLKEFETDVIHNQCEIGTVFHLEDSEFQEYIDKILEIVNDPKFA